MSKPKVFSIRNIILLISLIFAVLAINPNPWAQGIQVTSVRGIAAENGLKTGSIVESVNGQAVDSVAEFNIILNQSFRINATYVIRTNQGEVAFISSDKPEIVVKDVQKTNIEKGLDLEGGTRVLLRPVSDTPVTENQINDLIDVLNNRLNTYGLSDLDIRRAKDREGNNLVLVEIAGASRQDVKELVEGQGIFEAKIANKTVFVGGKHDITYVCKDDGSCSGIRACTPSETGYSCRFEFVINLSPEAAKKHAEITSSLETVSQEGGSYLSEPLDLYLDSVLVDTLRISEDLKGRETTSIAISGPGIGASERDAYDDALRNMNKLQTVLITGSLPLKLEIEKLDSISPLLGKEAIRNVLLIGFLSMLSVALVLVVRYRKFKIVIPIMITLVSEVLILLGVASLIQWRLDIVSIAGIVTAVGTGVDDQIVIVDEVLRKESQVYNWKQKIKRAFFIVFAAYATTVVAMIPLLNAGAGLVRGFAVTTIIGVTIGVFITRPAYASMIERLLEE